MAKNGNSSDGPMARPFAMFLVEWWKTNWILPKTTKSCKLFGKKLLRIGEEVIENSAQGIAGGVILTIRYLGNRELPDHFDGWFSWCK